MKTLYLYRINMFVLGCHITIGSFTFTRCDAVEIEKSSNLVAATAKITLPVTAVLQSKGEKTTIETSKAIRTGMDVTIKLAYQGVYDEVEFTGFVKRINYKIPLEVECEDMVYQLRKKNINKAWESTTLREVLEEIISGTTLQLSGLIPDITMSPYSIKNATGAFALQQIKDDYGLTVYILNNLLYCNLAYADNNGVVKYTINGANCNVINADDLKFHTRDDVSIKIKAVNINGDNTRTEVEIGDEEGALRTMFFYNIKTKAELEKLAAQELEKMKFDGYEGKLTTFLIPRAVPGMKAIVKDDKFPEREGSYYVDGVKTTWGTGGARREVEIGIKLS